MMFNCEDCGDPMEKQQLCVIMFYPLGHEGHIYSREFEGYHRVTNLCKRCRTLKRLDATKRYPPMVRRPVRQLKGTSDHLFAFECLKNRWAPQPVGLSGKPLWIYGNGELGRMALEYFRYVGVDVAGTFAHDEPAPLDAQVAVCIVRNCSYGAIEQRLWDRGFRDIAPFYDITDSIPTDHPWKNGWIGRPAKEDYEGMERVMERWSDSESLPHYLQFLAWRILREEWIFPRTEITKDNMFFIPEVVEVLHDHEIFLDGGAHHGQIAEQFAELVPSAGIVVIEADAKNIVNIPDRWPACAVALYDQDGAAPFAEGFGLCSKLTPTGNTIKTTRRIDSLGFSPTFIKLHLEGGELPALRGAAQTLLQCRPIVAVRVDHNDDGLWRTADYLMGLLPSYRFLFRNHVWCGAGAVVYAIPGERQCATR